MIKRIADRIFSWFCHPDYYSEIKGDLEELYSRDHSNSRISQFKYLLQVMGLLRPSIMRPLFKFNLTTHGMLKSYFKISTRNLLRHKLFTVINILGLAIGLSAFLLINQYIRFEESYDKFYSDSDKIYRLSTVQVVNGQVGTKDAMTFHPAPRTLKEELPGIEAYTVTNDFDEMIIRKGEAVIPEENVISADSNFFKVFSHSVIHGSPNTMLAKPNAIVLTESKARFYFGDENPVGNTLQALGSFNRIFEVTGVIKDIPQNTHYKYDMIISDESIKERGDYNKWNAFNFYGYVKLKDNASAATLNDQMAMLSLKYLGEKSSNRFFLYPIQDIHLNSDFTFEAEIPGSKKAVGFMWVIALFILIVAWINYINLSTARAVDRAKEVGLRKVIGAQKSQLISQFLIEALIINLLAALIALLISEMALPYFNLFVGKEIDTNVWNNLPFIKTLLLFFVIGTIVSGFYPALVLSGFKPVSVLKGKYRNSKSGVILRKGLVVLQFAFSIVLIAGTFIVNRQLQYMQGKDLGISTDYVVGFTMPGADKAQKEANEAKIASFKEVLRNHTAIETVGGTSNLPGGDGGDINSTTGKVRIIGLTDRMEGTSYIQYNDEYFLDAVDLELAAGRNFDRNRIGDTTVIMVNEAFIKRFNIHEPEKVLGELLQFGEDDTRKKFEIIGIIKDFNRTSLKADIEPTVYLPWYTPDATVVELDTKNYREGIDFITTQWKEFFPEAPLNYTFLDDRFAALYEQDRRFGEIFATFSALAIFIATLGLFGLSSFMAVQRTVEVGVRKVLGASISNIIGIFYKDFLVLLGFAAVVSLPLLYFGMTYWLENYAYRIDFPWMLSLGALLIVVVFALLTVGYQIYKVAVLDPVKTLKYE